MSNHTQADRDADPVITGIGAVCGYGWGEKRLREGLFGAGSAIRPLTAMPTGARHEPAWLALVDDEGEEKEREGRATRFAITEAVADAHDRGWRPGPNVGLLYGARTSDSSTALALLDDLDLHGPGLALTGGRSSGLLALLTAKGWLETGLADDVVVACADLWASRRPLRPPDSGLTLDGPPSAVCRPFQEGSVGANPGEAAVAMVVSGAAASPYAVVHGGAVAHGRGDRGGADGSRLRPTFDRALSDSGVDADAIAYVNTHGSGVPALDTLEAAVLDECLGSATKLYSVKPLVGDCGAAAGALELVAALYGFTTGVVPAPVRVAKGHPRLLDGPTASIEGAVAKTAIDDGDTCAAVILGPPQE